MDMYEAINTQNVQLAFEPEIEYSNRLQTYEKFVVAGMGGSHLEHRQSEELQYVSHLALDAGPPLSRPCLP